MSISTRNTHRCSSHQLSFSIMDYPSQLLLPLWYIQFFFMGGRSGIDSKPPENKNQIFIWNWWGSTGKRQIGGTACSLLFRWLLVLLPRWHIRPNYHVSLQIYPVNLINESKAKNISGWAFFVANIIAMIFIVSHELTFSISTRLNSLDSIVHGSCDNEYRPV